LSSDAFATPTPAGIVQVFAPKLLCPDSLPVNHCSPDYRKCDEHRVSRWIAVRPPLIEEPPNARYGEGNTESYRQLPLKFQSLPRPAVLKRKYSAKRTKMIARNGLMGQRIWIPT